MADTIEALKDKLQALEADSGGNKDRKKLEVALELCAALASLDMKRGVVQYADLAIDLEDQRISVARARLDYGNELTEKALKMISKSYPEWNF